MKSILTILAEKGGVGKTTTVIELAALFGAKKKKVLVIDMDSQASASGQLIGTKKPNLSVFDLMVDEKLDFKKVLVPAQDEWKNVAVIPGDRRLVNFSAALSDRIGIERLLAKKIAPAKEYFDYILIDTPPALGIVTANALCASTHYLVVTEATKFGEEAIPGVLKLVELIKENYNPKLKEIGVLVSCYQKGGSKSVRKSIDNLRALDIFIQDIQIPHSTKIVEAQQKMSPVSKIFPDISATKSYVELSKFIEERI